MTILNRRLLGCLGALLVMVIVVVIAAVVVVSIMRERELDRFRTRHREYMAEQIAEIRSGNRTHVEVLAPIGLECLVNAVDCLPKVKKVWIWSDLSDERWRLLKQLLNLEEIAFYDSPGTDTFLKHIQGMESLERIAFDATPLSDAGMKYIATLPNLKKLVVEGPDVTDAGFAYLRGHANLEMLVLSNTNVTDEGLAVLKEIPRLRSLVLFDRSRRGLHLTDAGLRHLKELTNLETLKVSGGWASEAAVHDLQKALPNCTIKVTERHISTLMNE